MQISRRHTLAPDLRNKALLNSALKSNLTVLVSPLQNKRRHTLTTAAILNSARKAVNQAHKVAEQQKRKSIGQMEGPCQDDVFMEGTERRAPLKPTNSRALRRENEERAASTPEGNLSTSQFVRLQLHVKGHTKHFHAETLPSVTSAVNSILKFM